MSKIYKALEKAERERPREFEKDQISIGDMEEKRQSERPELIPTPREVRGTVSDQRLVPLYQSDSLAAEQFRRLRTYLLRFKQSETLRTIMVTSSASGEGKTLISANLAAGIAHDLHSHALLVDCDLRNSALGEWFDLRNRKGLSDYLAGRGEISNLLVKSEVEKLSILPSGGLQVNPTELIASKKMEALVHELRSRYDDRYVILDSTPLLMTSEPQILSKFVDGILIVVRAGVTARETLKQALSSLDKGKILGLVLNDLEFKSPGLSSRYFGTGGYYHKNGYGYGYGYGYGHGKKKAKPKEQQRKGFRPVLKFG
jgi:exopolysaccharide/PEP-CTERM locus tyrosine autokinase